MTDEAQKNDDANRVTSTLDDLFPPSINVTLGDRKIEMHPLTFADLPKVQRMVPVYLAWLQSPRDATQATYLAEHWSELVPFVAASARLPEAAIASAYGGHCISLFIAAIEANLDFTHGSALVVHGMAGAELASKVFGPGPQP